MASASPRRLRWTDGQIERLFWAPQDQKEHEQSIRRPGSRPRLKLRVPCALNMCVGFELLRARIELSAQGFANSAAVGWVLSESTRSI
jgi:hypothetical protein